MCLLLYVLQLCTLLDECSSGLNLPFHFPESPALYCVRNAAAFGLSEVVLTQLVVDGVKLLITMEKRQEVNREIDELIPTQK